MRETLANASGSNLPHWLAPAPMSQNAFRREQSYQRENQSQDKSHGAGNGQVETLSDPIAAQGT